MKKQWMIAVILIGMLVLTGVGTVVYARSPLLGDQTVPSQKTTGDKVEKTDTTLSFSADISRIKFRGIWGYEGSNETCGYLGGVLVKRERVVVLKCLWKSTDNMTKGKIIGILKKGYFDGKIITQNQTQYSIVGLYRYDQEKNLLHLRWMTAQQTGWAHCRINMN